MVHHGSPARAFLGRELRSGHMQDAVWPLWWFEADFRQAGEISSSGPEGWIVILTHAASRSRRIDASASGNYMILFFLFPLLIGFMALAIVSAGCGLRRFKRKVRQMPQLHVDCEMAAAELMRSRLRGLLLIRSVRSGQAKTMRRRARVQRRALLWRLGWDTSSWNTRSRSTASP